MKLAADFRAQARQALRGKWPMAVLAGLLATLLGGATQNGPEIKFNLDLGSGTGRASLNYVGRELASVGTDFHLQFNGWLAGAAVYLTVVALALVVLLFVVGSVVGVGYSKFNLDLVDGQEANINRLFSYFSWWKTAVAASLLQGVLILLWSLLLIIPGIVASLSYAMTDYILAAVLPAAELYRLEHSVPVHLRHRQSGPEPLSKGCRGRLLPGGQRDRAGVRRPVTPQIHPKV